MPWLGKAVLQRMRFRSHWTGLEGGFQSHCLRLYQQDTPAAFGLWTSMWMLAVLLAQSWGFCPAFADNLGKSCSPVPSPCPLGSATGEGEQPQLCHGCVCSGGWGDVAFPAALVCPGMSTGAELSEWCQGRAGPRGEAVMDGSPSTAALGAALLRMTKCLLGQLSRVRAALLPQTQLQPAPGTCSLYLLALNHAWADLTAATEPGMKWLFPSSRRLSHLRHSWDSSFQCRTKDSASCC